MDRRWSQLKKGSALPVSASSDRACVPKPKTKERRFRSLADIYMNSPRCTLEDVEKLSKMTEDDYPKSNRITGKSGEGPSKKQKYKSKKISESVVGKKLPSESGEAEIRENHHVEPVEVSSDEKMQSSVVPTNSINATGQHATESTGPSSSSTGGARKLRLFGFNIDPTATQTCQVTSSSDNGLQNNQIDFMSINGGDQDAGGHLPHHTIIAAQPNMINEFGRLSAAASPVPRARSYLPLVAAPTNINDTVGYYNYPLPAAPAVLNHGVFMNGLTGFVPLGVAPGNIIVFQCLPAQSLITSHQLGSFNSQAVTISPTPWNSGVPPSSSRPIRPTPRRFIPPPSSS